MEQKNRHITRADLITFFDVPSRSLSRVLKDAEIELRVGGTRWSVVFSALGLAADQTEEYWSELTAPLLTAKKVASELGLKDPSIIYRWVDKESERYKPDFPKPLDLSSSRPNAKMKRWRRSEVIAWQCGKAMPNYRRLVESVPKPETSSEAVSAPSPIEHPNMFALPDFPNGEQQ